MASFGNKYIFFSLIFSELPLPSNHQVLLFLDRFDFISVIIDGWMDGWMESNNNKRGRKRKKINWIKDHVQ